TLMLPQPDEIPARLVEASTHFVGTSVVVGAPGWTGADVAGAAEPDTASGPVVVGACGGNSIWDSGDGPPPHPAQTTTATAKIPIRRPSIRSTVQGSTANAPAATLGTPGRSGGRRVVELDGADEHPLTRRRLVAVSLFPRHRQRGEVDR